MIIPEQSRLLFTPPAGQTIRQNTKLCCSNAPYLADLSHWPTPASGSRMTSRQIKSFPKPSCKQNIPARSNSCAHRLYGSSTCYTRNVFLQLGRHCRDLGLVTSRSPLPTSKRRPLAESSQEPDTVLSQDGPPNTAHQQHFNGFTARICFITAYVPACSRENLMSVAPNAAS